MPTKRWEQRFRLRLLPPREPRDSLMNCSLAQQDMPKPSQAESPNSSGQACLGVLCLVLVKVPTGARAQHTISVSHSSNGRGEATQVEAPRPEQGLDSAPSLQPPKSWKSTLCPVLREVHGVRVPGRCLASWTGACGRSLGGHESETCSSVWH